MKDTFKMAELPIWAKKHFESTKRFHLVVAHRKAKKTKTAFTYLVWKAIQTPASYWYLAQSHAICKENIWNSSYMHSSIPKKLIVSRDTSKLMWKIRAKTGSYSYIYLKGCDRPDLMRGPTPFGVVIDEYDSLKPEVWTEVISPIIYSNPISWVWIQGTFKGPRHLYELYQEAIANPEKWEVTFARASETGIIPDEALEDAKKSSRKDIYLQEYECQVIADSAHFFRGIDEVFTGNFQPYNPSLNYVGGVDFGRLRDASVLKIFDNNNCEVFSLEMVNLDFKRQIEQIANCASQYNAYLFADATSMGSAEATHELEQVYPKVEGVRFDNKTKNSILENLAIFIENKYLTLAKEDDKLKSQLKRFQYDIKDNGIMVLGTQKGHDDHVIACALAVYQLQKKATAVQQKELTPQEIEAAELNHMIQESLKKFRLGNFNTTEDYNY